MPLHTHVLNEIARLMRDPDALRHERERMPPSGRRGHYDPNQPRVPAGHSDGGQWMDTDGNTTSGPHDNEQPQLAQFSPDRSPVRTPARPPVRGPLGALLSLFAALSARNTPEQRAVLEFNAREFRPNADGEFYGGKVGVLNRNQVNENCPRLGEVQSRTNHATDVIDRSSPNMSAQQRGTAIHTHLKHQIENLGNPNFRAEASLLKELAADARYGAKGSIRIDVLENVGNGTVCVYDIKTGRSGLIPARMAEIAKTVLKAFPGTQRIVVSEIRPLR
ncbi:MAG: hypothetical protein K2Y71_13800 [Xanthobacteraceae bacterium]|nr:hypothetical protein [Xanthobacteraceae bacterium]